MSVALDSNLLGDFSAVYLTATRILEKHTGGGGGGGGGGGDDADDLVGQVLYVLFCMCFAMVMRWMGTCCGGIRVFGGKCADADATNSE